VTTATVEAVALRVPPWFLLTSELDATAADELIEMWLRADPELPGVNGVPETARALAAAWNRQSGGTTRCRMREAMHALQDVRDPPRPARRQLRLASAPDRTLLVAWMDAFVHEAGVIGGRSGAMVEAQLGRGGLLVWDDGGPVSLVGRSPPVAGVVRIGPVYTPPERRRPGYGASAVAAASRRSLAEGASKRMLLTDLSNPTSNKIYAEIGYNRFSDWEEHEFLTS
jgi:predicted GNAT family acetyltransferase